MNESKNLASLNARRWEVLCNRVERASDSDFAFIVRSINQSRKMSAEALRFCIDVMIAESELDATAAPVVVGEVDWQQYSQWMKDRWAAEEKRKTAITDDQVQRVYDYLCASGIIEDAGTDESDLLQVRAAMAAALAGDSNA